MTAYRLSTGGEIDRTRPISFSFDGKLVQAFAGDTVASALLASDIKVVGRSFKYHRPRGVWSHGSEEPNALVDISGPVTGSVNNRATVVDAIDGLMVRSVNSKPSAEKDKNAFIDRFSRFIPAAFYYKTFMFPNWHLYEPGIRDMAGLGRIDHDWSKAGLAAQFNDHCDILVVGAGPSGLTEALRAAREGKKVIVADEKWCVGGTLLHRDFDAALYGARPSDWIESTAGELEKLGVKLLLGTTAFGIYDHHMVGLNQRHRDGKPDSLWRIRPTEIIIASGAIERPLPFANNDLPGIMSADGALAYLRRHAILPGRKIVMVTNNSSAYEVAVAMAMAGAKVSIVDLRPASSFQHPGITVFAGRKIVQAAGRMAVKAVLLDDGTSLPCDAVLVSGGWSPTIHLYSQAKGKLQWNDSLQAFVPGKDIDGLIVVGAAAGKLTLPGSEPYSITATWPEPGQKGRIWIDFQNDVTAKDVELAARENFQSVEHLKRYTTLGMATDQGKTSNLTGLALMAGITGRTIPEVGTTTYRPPFTPVPIASLAGKRSGLLFNPVRRLPLENSHRDDGATFQEYGGWLRPAFYGKGDVDTEMAREAWQARQSVALFDGSTLGKIEVIGPQAAEFLDFIFYNTVSTLKPGKCRYGFILTETGIVYDDGVLVRLAEDHFVVSCSSSHVAGVHSLLEDWRQDRFDRTKVYIHNATANYATLTVTGPRSRELLSATLLQADLSDAALPHMSIAEGRFHDDPVRVTRVSFTGDRSYELSIRADTADGLWNHLKAVGRDLDASLLGSEALLLLRAEKGYIIVGKDTDGLTRPRDLGLTGPFKNKKVEFLGKRSLIMDDATRNDRKEFVGLDVADGGGMLPAGGHGIEWEDAKRNRSIGYVTSSYMSPTLNHPIALGLIERGMSRHGEVIDIRHMGEIRKARIVQPCALDPEGSRLHA